MNKNYLMGLMFAVLALAGCAPEVGSDRWCQMMQEKPKGDWSSNEGMDYLKHCVAK